MLTASVPLETMARALVGGLMLVAGGAKLATNRSTRQKWLGSLGLVPEPLIPSLAWTMPIMELMLGSTLLLGAGGRTAAAIGVVFLVMLTTAAAVSLMRGRRVDCGCFGMLSRQTISWPLVVRNAMLAGWLGATSTIGPRAPGVAVLAWQVQVAAVLSLSVVSVLAFVSLTKRRVFKTGKANAMGG